MEKGTPSHHNHDLFHCLQTMLLKKLNTLQGPLYTRDIWPLMSETCCDSRRLVSSQEKRYLAIIYLRGVSNSASTIRNRTSTHEWGKVGKRLRKKGRFNFYVLSIFVASWMRNILLCIRAPKKLDANLYWSFF